MKHTKEPSAAESAQPDNADRGLSFDGCGINGPDKYRERIATFTSDSAARAYGPLFEAAHGLLAATRAAVEIGARLGWDGPNAVIAEHMFMTLARQTIAKAEGKA